MNEQEFADLRSAANGTFSMFNALVEAGFTEQQALYLVAKLLAPVTPQA